MHVREAFKHLHLFHDSINHRRVPRRGVYFSLNILSISQMCQVISQDENHFVRSRLTVADLVHCLAMHQGPYSRTSYDIS